MSRENLLLVADSEHDANMLYAVGFFVPDPFVYLRVKGQAHLVMSDLEIDRARRKATHCKILSLSRCRQQLRREGETNPQVALVVQWLLKHFRLKKVLVPSNFPHGLAQKLRRLRFKVKVKKGEIFPERQWKTADEVKKISAALLMAEVGLAEGIQALKAAKISKDGRLLYHGAPLTSEKLRSIINVAVLQAGGVANHTIVAGGRQGCDPHEQGYGILRANQPILIDIFPRSQKTGYFGDITRTVVKGRASEAVRQLYHTVEKAQALAFSWAHSQIRGAEIHRAVQTFFAAEGYKTRRFNGRMEGFFHGTGHGIGLEVHESPRLSSTCDDTLKPGNVVTVEPGLYYPQLGGVRLEDVVLVTHNSPRNLTKFEKVLEL